MAIRPEAIHFTDGGIEAQIRSHSLLGNVISYRVEARGVELLVDVLNRFAADRGLAPIFVLALALLVFSFTAVSPVLTLITLVALGFLSFANVPGLQLYVVQLAKEHRPGAVDVASALNIAAFNLGIAIGAWLGGLVVESPMGLAATPWVGAILVAVALLLTLWSSALDRRAALTLKTA